MKPRIVGILGAVVLPVLLVPASPARSAQTSIAELVPYSMELLVDGAPLPLHAARGAQYVEAIEGREYAIRLTNNSAGRVAIALSVDGLNSIDAKTTAMRSASKWILDPWQSITLEGWQTSAATARRFYFTAEGTVVRFLAGQDQQPGHHLGSRLPGAPARGGPDLEERKLPEPQRLRGDADNAPAPSAAPQEKDGRSSGLDDLAATGIGRQVDHQVTRVPFDAEDSPAAVLNVRYEYHDALVKLGVLPRITPPCDEGLNRRERASGFQDSGFAPDPYGPRCP